MSAVTLHYIYDPLCGWCYGAEPLLQAAQGVVAIELHGGGMMTGANRQQVSEQLRNYVIPHDQRIAEYTGQPFGAAYFDGLLRDHTAVFDSAPPIAAILTAQQLSGHGLVLLARLQTAHYVEGRRIADRDVLLELAQGLDLASETFITALDANLGAPTQAHIQHSREWLAKVGAQGFPTLVLEQDDRVELIDISPWLGKPEAFAQWLRQSVASQAPADPANAALCGLDGCAGSAGA